MALTHVDKVALQYVEIILLDYLLNIYANSVDIGCDNQIRSQKVSSGAIVNVLT